MLFLDPLVDFPDFILPRPGGDFQTVFFAVEKINCVFGVIFGVGFSSSWKKTQKEERREKREWWGHVMTHRPINARRLDGSKMSYPRAEEIEAIELHFRPKTTRRKLNFARDFCASLARTPTGQDTRPQRAILHLNLETNYY